MSAKCNPAVVYFICQPLLRPALAGPGLAATAINKSRLCGPDAKCTCGGGGLSAGASSRRSRLQGNGLCSSYRLSLRPFPKVSMHEWRCRLVHQRLEQAMACSHAVASATAATLSRAAGPGRRGSSWRDRRRSLLRRWQHGEGDSREKHAELRLHVCGPAARAGAAPRRSGTRPKREHARWWQCRGERAAGGQPSRLSSRRAATGRRAELLGRRQGRP